MQSQPCHQGKVKGWMESGWQSARCSAKLERSTRSEQETLP
ncbi:hypothetical protein [Pseudomonas cremoricolorata]|nr:hypothetical protein [Pseudomonas cremoricolorata]